jgi:hypothetical protein
MAHGGLQNNKKPALAARKRPAINNRGLAGERAET